MTGAGKGANQRTHFCSADENLEAYGVGKHRHTPEIEQILDAKDRVVFTPHLAPLKRGLLSTVTLPLAADFMGDDGLNADEVVAGVCASFTRIHLWCACSMRGRCPRPRAWLEPAGCHIGLALNRRAGVLVAVAAIDNLCKGAAGQAVQCANIVYGWDQRRGLPMVAMPVLASGRACAAMCRGQRLH